MTWIIYILQAGNVSEEIDEWKPPSYSTKSDIDSDNESDCEVNK